MLMEGALCTTSEVKNRVCIVEEYCALLCSLANQHEFSVFLIFVKCFQIGFVMTILQKNIVLCVFYWLSCFEPFKIDSCHWQSQPTTFLQDAIFSSTDAVFIMDSFIHTYITRKRVYHSQQTSFKKTKIKWSLGRFEPPNFWLYAQRHNHWAIAAP